MLSSIFSSEQTMPGKGWPIAPVIAALLVIAVEIVFHVVPRPWLFGYGKGVAAYYEARHQVETFGPADIAVIGSSRGRESLVLPLLGELSNSILGTSTTVANYSCPNAKADELALLVELLCAGPQKPRLLLCTLSPRMLHGNSINRLQREAFGAMDGSCRQKITTALTWQTNAWFWHIRGWGESRYFTFRHRFRVRRLLTGIATRRRYSSPVSGGLTEWQRYAPQRSLLTWPLSESHVAGYVARLLDRKGRYVLGEIRLAGLRRIAGLCRQAGVPLALVEVPVSDILQRHYPAELYPAFHRHLADIAAEYGAIYLPVADHGIIYTDVDFRQQSHLNLVGGEKLTQVVAERIIRPVLTSTPAGP